MEDSRRPVLSIGVVADIIGVSVQTLRLWEGKGLISPARKGKDRYYSEDDLKRLKYIKYLLHEKKLNTYGVREVLLKENGSVGPMREKREEGLPSPAENAANSSARKKILIVDDDPDHVNILKMVLDTNGYASLSALSGRDGLFKIETESPDMVILDVMIPDIDGLEICRTIKSDPATAHIPVIIVSSMPENMRDKLGVGDLPSDAFVQKPVRPSEILAVISRLLSRR